MSAKTPRLPTKPTANNPNIVQIDETNPYNEFDRGLFACIQLQLPDGIFQDSLCRVAAVSVEVFQGELPVSIFTYQVLHFSRQPLTAEECKTLGDIYVDPRNGNSSFSFSTAGKDFSARMVEALCIRDFLTYKRVQNPSEWEDIEGRRRAFSFFAPNITAHHDLALGVSYVNHLQYFTSVDNLPLEHERSIIRYRGYELAEINPPIPEESWKKWGPGQFIEFESKMGSNKIMVQRALDHFVKHGHNQVKHLFE